MRAALALAGFLVLGPRAGPGDPAASLLERYDFDHRTGHFELPGRLREISGLAWAPGGGLLAHDDERGVVYLIDPATEQVGHGFSLGDPAVRDDFEGIALAGERYFLVSSRGRLFEFRRGEEGRSVAAGVTDTGLGNGCEIEGLAYHAPTRDLLLACKTLAPPSPEIRIHRLPLDPSRTGEAPIRVPLTGLAAFGIDSSVHPSGIEVAPGGETLVVVAARERLLVEVDLDGHVLGVERLSHKHHRQPEGIAFGPDGTLYIADEGGHGRGTLTWYAPRPEGG